MSSDDKAAKPPVTTGCLHYFPRALAEVAEVSRFGATKHGVPLEEKGFLRPEYTPEMYEDAIARHHLALSVEGPINVEDGGLLHMAQRAWNALAALEKFLIQEENEYENAELISGHCPCPDCERRREFGGGRNGLRREWISEE